jgi:uncharacterized DUF497 family protein
MTQNRSPDPILTFVLGFAINEILSQRRRASALVESSTAKAVGLLNDWFSAVTCITERDLDILVNAFRRAFFERPIGSEAISVISMRPASRKERSLL